MYYKALALSPGFRDMVFPKLQTPGGAGQDFAKAIGFGNPLVDTTSYLRYNPYIVKIQLKPIW
jgi:hypothetical protein